MDGVLLDVSQSYRAAILQTAKAFGAPITSADMNKVLCPFGPLSFRSFVLSQLAPSCPVFQSALAYTIAY